MKHKFEVYLPKTNEQLSGFIKQIVSKNPVKHYIIRIFDEYFPLEDLLQILEKHQSDIEKFRQNKSLVLWTESYFDEIPEFIPVAPSEEEALDIIDFEEIERDLMM